MNNEEKEEYLNRLNDFLDQFIGELEDVECEHEDDPEREIEAKYDAAKVFVEAVKREL